MRRAFDFDDFYTSHEGTIEQHDTRVHTSMCGHLVAKQEVDLEHLRMSQSSVRKFMSIGEDETPVKMTRSTS